MTVEPRRLLCLGDYACPSVHRSWDFDRVVAESQLSVWLDEAGYHGEILGDCGDVTYRDFPTCSFRGSASGDTVRVCLRFDSSAKHLIPHAFRAVIQVADSFNVKSG